MRNRSKIIKPIIFFFLVALVSSCSIKNTPVSLKSNVDLPSSFGEYTSNAISLDYRNFFKDTVLISLIDTAITSNYDVRIAMQRLKIARAGILNQSANLIPDVFVGAGGGVYKYGNFTEEGVGNFDTNFSENVNDNRRIPYPVTPNVNYGLSSSWEIDIWDKLKKLEQSAYYEYLSTEEGQRLVVTELVASVASVYYNLLEKENELEIIRKNIELQEQGVQLINVQKVAGRVTELAVKQFNAQLLNSQSLEFAVKQDIFELKNTLNLLLGRTITTLDRGPGILNQELPEIDSIGIPSDLLLNRPDLKQKEWQLQAANANIYAARAAFYPSLNINAFLGFETFKPRLMFNPGSLAFNTLANITAPIFNRKRLQANLKRVEAENYLLLYEYEQNIIEAFSEVLINLRGIENTRLSYEFKQRQVQELQNAVATSNDLFLGGYASYLEVVTAQRNVFEAELELMKARNDQFEYLINLYRSLGGGWEIEN